MTRENHIIVIPLPLQGHINPILQFAKRISSKGTRITVATTTLIGEIIQTQSNGFPFNLEIIPHVTNNIVTDDENFDSQADAFMKNIKNAYSEHLPTLVQKLGVSGDPVKAIVYDSFLENVGDVAHEQGLKGGAFSTQACAICAIYHHMQQGTLETPVKEDSTVCLPCLPIMKNKDLPSYMFNMGVYPLLLNISLSQMLNFQKADWFFFNTFDKLENELVKWMASQWPIKTIGPTIPSMFLDKRLEDDKDYGLSLFKPDDEETYMKWLDTKDTGSVVYVSFGSLAALGEDQMEQLSCAFISSKHHFLWVVRDSEKSKLPSNITVHSERIFVVSWCRQLNVLAHRAIGCFMTHCGWNSTLEALSLGVPMLAFPQWTDQTTNAKFIADVWDAGIRVKVDEKGFVTGEEIEMCIKQVMDGEGGNKLRKNAIKWKEYAKEALSEGGSSDQNINDFISALSSI